MKDDFWILSGPTASGKTKISIELAKNFPIEIINFDSLNFYHELKISTARPDLKDFDHIHHHLFSIRSIKQPLNAAQFHQLAKKSLDKIRLKGKIPLLVGGSGFYLKALTHGMWDSKSTPQDILDRSKNLYTKEGIGPFLKTLKDKDPESFEKLHPNDHYRIRRAVEHYWSTGSSYYLNKKHENQRPLWRYKHLFLEIDKSSHLEIIKERSISLIKNGIIDEIQSIVSNPDYSGLERPLLSIGPKETILYLKGLISTKKELVESINIATRKLAKAQKTWFKKIDDKSVLNPLSGIDKVMDYFHKALYSSS